MPSTIRIVVADDHPRIRGGVVRTLDESDDMEVLGECGSAGEVIETVGRLLPDVVLLDISMPGGGLEAARQIGQPFPAVHIAMLTVSEEDDDVLAALQAGARGYALKGRGGGLAARARAGNLTAALPTMVRSGAGPLPSHRPT